MPNWTAFVGLTGVVLVLLLLLARASQGIVRQDGTDTSRSETERPPSESPHRHPTEERDASNSEPVTDEPVTDEPVTDDAEDESDPVTDVALSRSGISTGILLVNVALSQGLFAVVLVAGAWYTEIPMSALGVDLGTPASVGLPALGVGLAAGTALYTGNAIGAASAAALGYDHEERLRDLLTPESPTGWVLLLGGVLPVIAGFEELLFRGALIGVIHTGFGISPWFLAGASSAAFAFGHGAQGRLGIVVTGVLGFALAVVFIHTNSLLAVVVAHYVVNALEFVVGGALGIEWG